MSIRCPRTSTSRGRSTSRPPSTRRRCKAIRLFTAIDFSAEVRDRLAESGRAVVVQLNRGRDDWKQTRTEQLHLTLKFLGETDPSKVGELLTAMESVAALTQPFTLSLAGLGAFPNPGHAQILWAGVTAGVPELERLARDIDQAFEELGISREERGFRAHVTLARIGRRARARSITSALANRQESFGTQDVREVVLFESRAGSNGHQHIRLGAASLRAP